MDDPFYSILKEKAVKTAKKIGPPSFYKKHKEELDNSLSLLSHSKTLRKCRSYIDESKLHPAHGLQHCEKVAVEAGAILHIEAANKGFGSLTEELMLCVQIAGLLHDIKRNENNHPLAGSIEDERVLHDFDLEGRYKRYITEAIRNHEAFKEVLSSEDNEAKLISDSLYDADKFRWGPDNFTITLWLLIEASGTPAKILYSSFLEKMEGIKRIKHTFRTATGRTYGPEFIDFGIEIGNELYREMEYTIGN